jgi:hypothetical protein
MHSGMGGEHEAHAHNIQRYKTGRPYAKTHKAAGAHPSRMTAFVVSQHLKFGSRKGMKLISRKRRVHDVATLNGKHRPVSSVSV